MQKHVDWLAEQSGVGFREMKKVIAILVLGLLVCNIASTESSLPECKGDDHRQWTDCQGTYTYMTEGEDKYIGELKDGWEHGQGTFTLADGSKYVGEFKNDLIHGYGTATNFDGRTVKGIFKDGKLFKQQ